MPVLLLIVEVVYSIVDYLVHTINAILYRLQFSVHTFSRTHYSTYCIIVYTHGLEKALLEEFN